MTHGVRHRRRYAEEDRVSRSWPEMDRLCAAWPRRYGKSDATYISPKSNMRDLLEVSSDHNTAATSRVILAAGESRRMGSPKSVCYRFQGETLREGFDREAASHAIR